MIRSQEVKKKRRGKEEKKEEAEKADASFPPGFRRSMPASCSSVLSDLQRSAEFARRCILHCSPYSGIGRAIRGSPGYFHSSGSSPSRHGLAFRRATRPAPTCRLKVFAGNGSAALHLPARFPPCLLLFLPSHLLHFLTSHLLTFFTSWLLVFLSSYLLGFLASSLLTFSLPLQSHVPSTRCMDRMPARAFRA